jgi:hypothetical protein
MPIPQLILDTVYCRTGVGYLCNVLQPSGFERVIA